MSQFGTYTDFTGAHDHQLGFSSRAEGWPACVSQHHQAPLDSNDQAVGTAPWGKRSAWGNSWWPSPDGPEPTSSGSLQHESGVLWPSDGDDDSSATAFDNRHTLHRPCNRELRRAARKRASDNSPCDGRSGNGRVAAAAPAGGAQDRTVRRHRAEAAYPKPTASWQPDEPLSIEVLLAWSGRKFSCIVDGGDLLPELRRRLLDEAGLRGECGTSHPRACRMVSGGRELVFDAGGFVRNHVADGARILVLGPRF